MSANRYSPLVQSRYPQSSISPSRNTLIYRELSPSHQILAAPVVVSPTRQAIVEDNLRRSLIQSRINAEESAKVQHIMSLEQ